MGSCTFRVLDELPSLSSQISYLSVASADPNWHENLKYGNLHILENDTFSKLPELLTYLQTTKSCDLTAENNGSVLKFASKTQKFSLRLTDQAYSHNAYVGRYLKFRKHVPLKKSADLDIFYDANAILDPQQRYFKDFNALVLSLFGVCSVTLLLSEIPPFPLTDTKPEHLKFKIAPYSDLNPLGVSEITTDNSQDFYEYLCLLHLNGLPDLSDSLVVATNMYQPPAEGKFANNEKLNLYVTRNAHPGILEVLIKTDGWVSAIARIVNESILLFKTSSVIYIWHVQN